MIIHKLLLLDGCHTSIYLKNAFKKIYVTSCRRFRLNEGGVATYDTQMKAEYTVNFFWGMQIAGMIFQTRSNLKYLKSNKKDHSYKL